MEIKLSKEAKARVLEKLLEGGVFENLFSDGGKFVEFISGVFPLEQMPSLDSRHEDAAGDFSRHLIMNDDWSLEYVLKERLDLSSQNDPIFIKFIETFVSPQFQDDIESIYTITSLISPELTLEGIRFVLTGYEDSRPIYKLTNEDGPLRNIPKDVKKNDLPFYLKPSKGFPHLEANHDKPSGFPSFVLVKDNWNDFGATTLFHVFSHPNEETVTYIGAVKIMKRGEMETNLPSEFYLLDETFCSLGTGEDYYQNLERSSEDNFISLLFSLRDAAFFPMIYEEFEEEKVFKESLVRNDDTERSARTVAYTYAGGDLASRYQFKFSFKPPFDDKETQIHFPFTSDEPVPKRIIALIGKNGTGKTQLLTSLAKNLSDRNSPLFLPQTPIFGKVLAVSYSVFDTFEIPKSDNSFNYHYCGLKGHNGKLLSEVDLESRFYESVLKIKRKKRVNRLLKVLRNFIDNETLYLLISEDNNSKEEYLKVNIDQFTDIKKRLSSGQSLLLYIVVEILAELRFDSLILFDEPETHLHPNAITQLISVIYDLVAQFDSYCIIATHSPIIVQSLTSDSVYVTEKEDNRFSIRRISTESFGENLSNITEDIFGNREAFQEYKKIIHSLNEEGRGFEEIIEILESDDVPLSLNAKIYIRSIINN